MQNILALEVQIKTPVIMQVILKNPWLINDSFLKDKSFKLFIKNNLSIEDSKQYLNALKDIAKDNIFSTNEFKLFIENFYYNLIDISKCEEIIQTNSHKPQILLICIKRIIMESLESSETKIHQINDFFGSNDAAYYLVKNNTYLNDIIKTLDDESYVAQWILENKAISKIDPVWANAFISLNKHAFDISSKYIRSTFEFDNTSKWIIRNVFQKLINKNDDNLEYYIKEIVDIYKNRNAYRIKVLFLDMLQPGKFRDNKLANSLLNEFDKFGIADKYMHRVEQIRNGEEERDGYTSAEEAFSDIDKPNTDISKQKTLDYISKQLRKTNNDILVQLYVKYQDNFKIKQSISYYIANEMRKKPSTLIAKIGILSEEYIEVIVDFISINSIKSDTTINFLHINNRPDIIQKLTRR